jgi:hypothetical protein
MSVRDLQSQWDAISNSLRYTNLLVCFHQSHCLTLDHLVFPDYIDELRKERSAFKFRSFDFYVVLSYNIVLKFEAHFIGGLEHLSSELLLDASYYIPLSVWLKTWASWEVSLNV